MIVEKCTSWDWQDGKPRPVCYLCMDRKRDPDLKHVCNSGKSFFAHADCANRFAFKMEPK
jgi:hypothetical protein